MKSNLIKRKFLLRLPPVFDKIWSRLKEKFDNIEPEAKEKIEYQILTPDNNADEKATYSEALKAAITRRDCYNIGLTGPFGSGKSSILKAFEKRHNNEFNFLSISLATFSKFDDLIGVDEDLSGREKLEEITEQKSKIRQNLEISILQQLLYKERPTTLPDSRFSRIRTSKRYKIHLWASFILIWIYSFVLLLEPSFLANTTIWSFLDSKDTKCLIMLFSWFIFTSGLLILIYKVIKHYRGFTLGKLNLTKGEISLHKIDQLSILNKHLDELIYFFENTNYNVVLIEDLDRFDDESIFTNLREINFLLNNSAQIERKITFIYAIRDDLFKKGQQTKFFDFIVPVIPIVNTSNSGDKLFEWFSNTGLTDQISSSFLHDLSLFINDMRLAKNIFNEFLIYNKEIGSKLSKEKLLGVVVLKNLFPEEFSKLHSGSSLINRVLDTKKIFRDRLNEKLGDENVKLSQKLSTANADLDEIRKKLTEEYGSKLRSELMNPEVIYLDNIEIIDEDDNSELFEAFLKNDVDRIENGSGNIEKKLSLEQFESKLNLSFSEDFSKKTRRIRNEIHRIQTEITINDKDVSELSSWKLGDMLRYDAELFKNCLPSKTDIESSLEYLMINEYVDENYINYISFYHEGTITQQEKDFLVNVKNFGETNYEVEIIHPLEVIAKIELFEFRRVQVLNIKLVDYLFGNSNTYKEQIRWIIQQSLNSGKGFKEFIRIYVIRGSEIGSFLTELTRTWKNLWNYVMRDSDFEKNEIKNLFILMLEKLEKQTFKELDNEAEVSQFILSEKLFYEYPETINDKLVSIMETLELRLDSLEGPIENEGLFESVISKSLYKISYSSLKSILEYYLQDEFDLEEFNSSNYTYLLNRSSGALKSYVHDSMDTYINQVYLNLSSGQIETQDAKLDLMGDPTLDRDTKVKIIDKFETKFETCEDVEDELIPLIYATNKVTATWKNVSVYYSIFGAIDESLIEFYNHSASELSSIVFDSKEENSMKIRREIILCNEINFEPYRCLIKSIPFNYSDLVLNELHSEKVRILIDNVKINLTDFYLDNIRKYHSELTILLFEKNQNVLSSFLDKSEFNLTKSEMMQILNSQTITTQLQLKSIKSRIYMVSIYGNDFSEAICKFVIRNNSIFDLTENNIRSLLRKSEDYESKTGVLSLALGKFKYDKEFVKELINAVGQPLNKVNIKKGWFNIKNNPNILSIIDFLHSNDYISSYSIQKSKKMIRITRKN